MGFIDTHSHLWVPRLRERLPELLSDARRAGVENMLLCAGGPSNWDLTREVACEAGLGYLLGIHPLALDEVGEGTLEKLRDEVAKRMTDPHFIGIGEVGLDGFVPGIDQALAKEVFLAELRIARDFSLPLSIHVRRSGSQTMGALRRLTPPGGAVHAFNGSDVERDTFLGFALRLGFGGAATYAGSKRIRRHLAELPDGAWLLETDAPDMPGSKRRDAHEKEGLSLATEPADILEAAKAAAQLRGITVGEAAKVSRDAAIAAFPRLPGLLALPDAFAKRFGSSQLD